MMAQFSSVAGMLDSAEGTARIGSNHTVDKGQARLDLVDEELALGFIVGPGTGPKTKLAVIGDANGISHALRTKYGSHRPEQIILKCRRAFRNVRQDCGLKEIALAISAPSAQQHPRTQLHGSFDLLLQGPQPV